MENKIKLFKKLAKNGELDIKALNDNELLELYSNTTENNLLLALEKEIEDRDLNSPIDWENIEIV